VLVLVDDRRNKREIGSTYHFIEVLSEALAGLSIQENIEVVLGFSNFMPVQNDTVVPQISNLSFWDAGTTVSMYLVFSITRNASTATGKAWSMVEKIAVAALVDVDNVIAEFHRAVLSGTLAKVSKNAPTVIGPRSTANPRTLYCNA
jgi:hypothetical protein